MRNVHTCMTHALPFLCPANTTQVADEYVKLRKEFGKHCRFSHVPAFELQHIPTTSKYSANYVMRNPSVVNLDTCPHMYAAEFAIQCGSGVLVLILAGNGEPQIRA